MMPVLGLAWEFIQKHLWIVGLVAIAVISHSCGDSYATYLAYHYPAVKTISVTKTNTIYRDRSLTTESKITHLDGTVEEKKTIQAMIDTATDTTLKVDTTSTPVSLRRGAWGYGTGYAPFQHELAAKVDWSLDPFTVTISHPIGTFGDSFKFVDGLAPQFWLTWRP